MSSLLSLQQLRLPLVAEAAALTRGDHTSPVDGVHLREEGEEAVQVARNRVIIPVGVAEMGHRVALPLAAAVDDGQVAGDEGRRRGGVVADDLDEEEVVVIISWILKFSILLPRNRQT